MAYNPEFRGPGGPVGARVGQPASVLDAGLRAYILRVYNWMASGLLLSGIVAYLILNTDALYNAFYPLRQTEFGLVHVPGPLAYLSMFAPLAFVLVLSFGVNKLSTRTVQTLYWVFCAAMGASISNILRIYTHESVATVFFVSAATFAATSLYGYTTRSDLSRMGSFLFMGLIGIIIASVVNMLIGSTALQFAISVIGVVVFVGLTAYDTQRIKSDYVQYSYAQGSETAARRSVYDALQLFLNFINLFMLLLQLTGNRSSNN